MYVTRPLSQLLKSPESLAAPPEGPNSGYLVIKDEESETYSCFGCCKNRTLKELPFPSNKELAVRYVTNSWEGTSVSISEDPLFLIPVLNQPLSSNRYYAIVPHGKHKGEAYTCSREEDKATCCFCRCTKDAKPKPLDPHNIYQQFEMAPYKGLISTKGDFVANSVASDGFPPYFVRRGGWAMHATTPRRFKLDTEARGLDSRLRARLPEFNFSVSRESSEPSVVVGRWYSPFVFVREGRVKDQVKRAMYYESTLEQRWEKIFGCRNKGKKVVVDTTVEKEQVFISGSKAAWDEKNVVDGVIWFRVKGSGRKEKGVGLRVELVERMKWEQKRGGFRGGGERVVKINRVEEVKKGGKWDEFGCYILVERFNLKRMDGSLVISCDFKHFHQMKTKWE